MPLVRTPGLLGVVGAGTPFARPLAVPFTDADPLSAVDAGGEAETEEVMMPFVFGTAVAPARCGEDDVASSPTRLLLVSALGFSGWSLMVVRAGFEPKLGDW